MPFRIYRMLGSAAAFGVVGATVSRLSAFRDVAVATTSSTRTAKLATRGVWSGFDAGQPYAATAAPTVSEP